MARLLTVATVLLVASGVAADQVRGVTIGVEQVVAARGGVLMVPLTARRHGDQWPGVIDVRLDDGRRVEGRVALITSTPPLDGSWTGDPEGVRVRPIVSTDDSSRDGTPYLLAPMPADADGPVEIRRRKVRVRWVELQAPVTIGPPLVVEARPDRPDPRSPFEHWRWVLLAEQLRRAAPSASRFGPLAAMVAERQTQLWRAGLARLDTIDAPLAVRCRMLLTRLCHERDRMIAGWVADPTQTSALLALLLDDRRPPDDLRLAVDAWRGSVEPVLTWLASAGPERVTLVMINRGERPVVTTFAWTDTEELPIAVELPEGRVTRVLLDRPIGTGEDVSVLDIELAGGRTYALPVPPAYETARPPAAFNVRLRPPLTLAQLESGQTLPAPPDRATTAQLRRRAGRWELFLECRRAATRVSTEAGPDVAPPLDAWPQWTEAVVVLIGSEDERDGPGVELVIPETGRHRVRRGRDDASLGVHRRSYEDRWYCRVELPDSWLPFEDEVQIGCVRTFGDAGGFQTGPGATAAWRPLAGRRAVILSEWESVGPPR